MKQLQDIYVLQDLLAHTLLHFLAVCLKLGIYNGSLSKNFPLVQFFAQI